MLITSVSRRSVLRRYRAELEPTVGVDGVGLGEPLGEIGEAGVQDAGGNQSSRHECGNLRRGGTWLATCRRSLRRSPCRPGAPCPWPMAARRERIPSGSPAGASPAGRRARRQRMTVRKVRKWLITSEELVAAESAQRDGDPSLAGRAGHEVGIRGRRRRAGRARKRPRLSRPPRAPRRARTLTWRAPYCSATTFANRLSSNLESSSSTVMAVTGPAARSAAMARTTELSIPPDTKTPSGTSATSCMPTAARSSAPTASIASLAVAIDRQSVSGSSQ